jgi:hypothetical protein
MLRANAGASVRDMLVGVKKCQTKRAMLFDILYRIPYTARAIQPLRKTAPDQ